MILVERGVNSSMEEYATPLVWRLLDAAQAGEHQSVPIVGDAAQQTILQMHNSPNRECYLASIALDSLDRSRLVSSGEAAFPCTQFAALGSIAIFAHGGGYAGLEAHRSHRCDHEQGRLRPWPHSIPTTS
jgi:hypothetical protein